MRETFGAMAEPAPNGKLPTAFHGYSREAVDKLLGELEESYRALIAERDELRAKLSDSSKRLDEASAQLENHARQEHVIADAMIEAERLKAESEQQASTIKGEAAGEAAETRRRAAQAAQELRAAAERDAETTKQRASSEADELLRGARSHADRLVGEMEERLGERQRQAEELLDDVGARLGSLVRDLFEQAGAASQERSPAVESEPRAL